ncbi:MAG TPA: cysteine desulfurase family protein [Candidatus Limnocylindria bacterium]|nr:cysteine desulfurase family protein [Candidatus Limnocylindria bacterium]
MAIYLDHAATSPLRPEVLEAMLPYLTEHTGNPSSLHASGRRARQGVDEARERLATLIGAAPREIVFTAGGTEADNLALKGVAWAASPRGRHVVISAVEHRAIANAAAVLERSGFEVTTIGVDSHGRVDPAQVAAALTDRTTLVSVMAANNEVGTLQPIAEIGAVVRESRALFHIDAVQWAAHLPIDVDAWQADLVSLSAHKLGGPQGVGALFVRRGTQLLPQLQGGSQERQRRAGTENVAGIVGMGAAFDLVHGDAAAREAEAARLAPLAAALRTGILALGAATLTGHPDARLPDNVSAVLEGIEGGDLVAALDLEGIEVSTGSACTSGSTEPSHVLLAMGIEPHLAHGSLRITMGPGTGPADVDAALDALRRVVPRLREGAVTPVAASA